MPESWAEDDASIHSSISNHRNDALDRQLLRHLMQRYGRDGIAQLMDEEATSPAVSIHDGASVISSSTYSSVKSEDAPSIFDAASIRTFSSDNSSHRGSIISNVSARTAKFLGRRSQSSASKSSSQLDQDTSATPSAQPSTPAPKQKGSFTCGFCSEEDIQKTCTRKNDLKRHIEDFHNTNAQWFCRHPDCNMVFDWQTAYKTHLKHAHGGSRMALDEAKVNLCPQTVFACGFENCRHVLEAPSDDDADAVFKDFVTHIVKHFDEGANSGEWTYSGRMRNLLRQDGLARAWANSSWAEEERNQLNWEPQSSGILRKRLETRHLGDLQVLVQYIIALGSEPSSITGYCKDFINPIKDECRQPIIGHKSRAPPLPPSGPSPDLDQYQFRISRGSNNQGIAAYYAAQRRAFVPRPGPVRSGRSARPPRNSVSGNAQQQQIPPQFRYSNVPQAQAQAHMFDPRQQQQFAMMQQANGGIIAEDLRSLRSMAASQEGDVEMADPDMMGTFMQETGQGFQGYGTQSGDGPCLTPTSMNRNGQMGYENYDSF